MAGLEKALSNFFIDPVIIEWEKRRREEERRRRENERRLPLQLPIEPPYAPDEPKKDRPERIEIDIGGDDGEDSAASKTWDFPYFPK